MVGQPVGHDTGEVVCSRHSIVLTLVNATNPVAHWDFKVYTELGAATAVAHAAIGWV